MSDDNNNVSRNPFFNFLKVVRADYVMTRETVIETARLAGERWRQMSDAEKRPYREMAEKAHPTTKKRSR